MAGSDDAQKKKRIAIIAVSSFLLVAMVIAVTVGVSINETDEETNNGSKNAVSSSMKAIKSVCKPTDFKKTCEEQLKAEAGNSTDVKELIKAAFKAAKKFASRAAENSTTLRDLEKDPRTKKALGVCRQLMTYSMNELEKSFDAIEKLDVSKFEKMLSDIKIWLSATIANQETCLDGFENTTTTAGEKMQKALNISMQLSRNGLAIATELATALKHLDVQGVGRRRLLQSQDGVPVLGHTDWSAMLDDQFPEYQVINRRLLQDDDEVPVLGHMDWSAMLNDQIPETQGSTRRLLMEANVSTLKPDAVVAKDGSGEFNTIKAAMAKIPLNSPKPFIIYIKEGVYEENLEFGYSMINVALFGDGKEKTRITGHLNNADGIPTFRTATVAINGDRFFAKNIGFENSAGAAKFQAVALMVISDFSVFYNCSMDGYQDTLYVHSKRQFYRDCTISGTIDFVFGDAAAVFQSCTFLARKPLDKQQNIVTAHGRFDGREPTALIIQNSTFIADPELAPVKDKFPTYLGRPWGNFSRTIIMESYLSDVIKSEGWTTWDGEWGLNTCFYTELDNVGPGSNMAGRVTWPGIKKIKPEEAIEFTPAKFFDGDSWVKPTRVPYVSGFFNNNNTATSTVPESTAI